MTRYSPSQVGYPCAAMMHYRPEAADSKRIEIYPLSQWGPWMPDYDGPESAALVSARAAAPVSEKGEG